MAKMLLKAGKIFDGESFIDADILIENDKIIAIDKSIDGGGAMQINCSGCIISSGLVDIHTHLLEMGNNSFGFPADMATIPFGVTYAVDACAEDTVVSNLDRLCVQTAVFVPIIIKGDSLDYEKMEQRIRLYGERVVGIKVYFDESLKNGTTEQHFRLACKFAQDKRLKVMVHCSYSPLNMEKIVDILQSGDIITHSYHGAYHTIAENDYLAYKKAKEKGVIIDAGMAGGVHTDFAVLKNAIEKGCIPDVISSDITCFSAYMRGGIYGLPMCMSIARICGMKEIDVFKSVTLNAAKAVDKEEWFGLRVGVKATLSVMAWGDTQIDICDRAGNSLISEKGYVCKIAVKNGQIIYRN